MATAEQEVEKPLDKPNTAKPRFDHPITTLCVFKVPVVIQQKGGIIVKGRLKWFRKGFLKLTDVEVIGVNKQVKTDWLLLDHQTIAHVHPDPDAKEFTK